MDKRIALWHRLHSSAERSLAESLAGFFNGQTRRVLAKLAHFDAITPSTVPQVFHPADERRLMWDAVSPAILRTAAVGASTQLTWIRSRQGKRTKAGGIDDFKLPEDIKQTILDTFSDLEKEDYWQDIQATTSERLTDTINAGIEAGDNHYYMAKRIEEALGYDAKIRAMAIARTEVTGAFNAGHDATYRALAADGLISGKTWLATLDGDVRETHSRNHEKTVPADGEFDVGGHSAPYPGHHKLPAKERVRCRCTTVAAFEDAIVVPVAKPKPTPEEKPKPPKSGPLAELRNKLDAIVKSPEWLAEMERQKTFDAENNKGADIREEAARRYAWFSEHRAAIRAISDQAETMTAAPAKGKGKQAKAIAEEAMKILRSSSAHQVFTDALKVPQSRRADISIDVSGKMAEDAKQKEMISAAREFLNSIADKGVIKKVSTVKCRNIAEDNSKSGLSSDDRAYYHDSAKTTYHSSRSDISTHIHETGHHLEYEIPGLQTAVNEFHAKVTAGSGRVHMGKRYDADEFYFPRSDGKVWMHNYMGKDYSAWKHGPDKTHATELTSMGVQYLYECPSSLAKSDPELFDILVDHLRGHR